MHFLISGDSWSQGEWADNNIVHRGLHQYLLDDNHIVTNVGRGGFNNIEAWDQVKSAIWNEIDHLIFFYADSLRHVGIADFENQLPSEIVERHADWFEQQVENLKKEYPQLKITVIGGGSCFPRQTSNVIDYLVPSMNTMLFPNYKDSPYQTSYRENFTFFLESKTTRPTAEHKREFVEIMVKCESKLNLWKLNPDYFPDCRHANRLGHLKLYQHLQTIWA